MPPNSIARLLFGILTSASLTACQQVDEPAATESKPRLVRTMVVSSDIEGSWRELPGVVDAAKKADLSFRIPGKLVSLSAKEGDDVSRDDVLAKIDDAEVRIQLKSREAEYASAHADYRRGSELIKTGVISKSDFNKLQAQDATAKANLDAARKSLEYTQLEAPFDGRIAIRHVDNFEEVNAKQPVYTLQDTSNLLIRINVPESLMIRVREGARPDVWAQFSQLPDKSFPLTLKEVSTRADKDTNTFAVTFSMENDGAYNILPGMSATVRGKPPSDRAASDGVFQVPAHAVLEDNDGRYLFTVESAADGHSVVQRRAVETGRLSQLGLEITSGLSEGDRIVTAGMSKMRPGLEVRLTTEAAGR